MPSSYLIDVPNGVVYSKKWGVLTDEQVAAYTKALWADPRFDPEFRQIVDFRQLTEIRVSGAAVREIARDNAFRRDARRAFIVASDEAFGLTRMFGMFTDSKAETFGIVRTLEAAFEWIGMEPTASWPTQPPDATFGLP
jgi:hypothetical protein